MDGDSINEGIVCEKVLRISVDLKQTSSKSAEGESVYTFKASRGWFKKLNHRSGIHSAVRHEEAASSSKDAAERYVGE